MKPVAVKYNNGIRSGVLLLKDKVTIIMDNSGTGKSTLMQDLRRDLVDIEVPLGFELISLPDNFPAHFRYPEFIQYFKLASGDRTPIFYVDEDASYLHLRSFQRAVKDFLAIFIFINRDEFGSIPYACHQVKRIIYERQPDGKYITHLENLYSKYDKVPKKINKLLYFCPEDSISGKKLYEKYGGFTIAHADGKGNIHDAMKNSRNTLFVVDEVGFGKEIKAVYNELNRNLQNNNALLMIPSFEGMLLKSKFLRQDTELCRQAYAKALEKWSKTSSNGALCVVSNYEDLYTTFLQELLKLYNISHNWKKGNTPKCLLDDCCWRPKECAWKMDGNKCELLMDKALCECLKQIKANRIRNQIPDSVGSSIGVAADTTSMFQNRGELPASKQ